MRTTLLFPTLARKEDSSGLFIGPIRESLPFFPVLFSDIPSFCYIPKFFKSTEIFFHTIDPNIQKMWMLETESLFLEEEHSNAVQSLRWEEEMKTDNQNFCWWTKLWYQGTTRLSNHKKLSVPHHPAPTRNHRSLTL